MSEKKMNAGTGAHPADRSGTLNARSGGSLPVDVPLSVVYSKTRSFIHGGAKIKQEGTTLWK